MTKKKTPVAVCSGAGAENSPTDSRTPPVRIAQEHEAYAVSLGLSRRRRAPVPLLVVFCGPAPVILPMGTAADNSRHMIARHAIVSELLEHLNQQGLDLCAGEARVTLSIPTPFIGKVKVSYTSRSIKSAPFQSVVNVLSREPWGACVLNDLCALPFAPQRDRETAVRLLAKRHQEERRRLQSEYPRLATLGWEPKGRDVVERGARWLFRNAILEEKKYALAKAYWADRNPDWAGDKTIVRDGIDSAKRLLGVLVG